MEKKAPGRRASSFVIIKFIIAVVVLVIIGIIAVPRFVNIPADIRASDIEGIANAVRAASQLVRVQALVEGKDGTSGNNVLIVDGQSVTVNSILYPVTTGNNGSDGIASAANISSPKPVCNANTCTWTLKQGCSATYTAATGTVQVDNSGCQ